MRHSSPRKSVIGGLLFALAISVVVAGGAILLTFGSAYLLAYAS